MGVVWRATDELLDRTVALKQVRLESLDLSASDTARQRVLREARAAARLHHPNAVTVFDVIVEGTEPWLVLEYVPSQSLADRIRAEGPSDAEEAARIGRGIAAALAAAHERGIVHRDVKPANILLGESGAVKLTDFGIARAVGDLTLTASGMMIGTPAYLAPEVANGAAATAASDVFGLGATLYAAVEGAPPFGSGDDGNVLLLLRRAAEGRVPPPQRAGRLTDVLMRMLDPDPARRPLAAEVVGLLAPPVPQVPAAPTLIGPLPGEPVAVPKPRIAQRWLMVGATVLTVAAIVTTVLVQGAARPPAIAGGPAPSPAAPVSAAMDKCDKSRGELVVGMITPLTGGHARSGNGMRNAAQLAVDQANTNCMVPGYRVALRPLDDKSTEADAAAAARAFVADPAVVGVVGTFLNETAEASQPVLAAARVPQVAPAVTGPPLTRGSGPVAKRPHPQFFRITGTDLGEGPIAAEWLVRSERKRNFAVVDDTSGYGVAMRTAFVERVASLGAAIVVREVVDGAAPDYSAVIARIVAARPDAVYYGGDDPAAGRLSTQLAAAGLNVPVVGGQGVWSTAYTGRDGDLAVTPGAELTMLPTSTPFATAYEQAGFADPATEYGAFAYDAATVLITALGRVTADGPWHAGRLPTLVEEIQRVTLSGATGTITFDEFGDNPQAVYTINRATGGKFVPAAAASRTP